MTTVSAPGARCSGRPSACSSSPTSTSSCFFTSGADARISSPQFGQTASTRTSLERAASRRVSRRSLVTPSARASAINSRAPFLGALRGGATALPKNAGTGARVVPQAEQIPERQHHPFFLSGHVATSVDGHGRRRFSASNHSSTARRTHHVTDRSNDFAVALSSASVSISRYASTRRREGELIPGLYRTVPHPVKNPEKTRECRARSRGSAASPLPPWSLDASRLGFPRLPRLAHPLRLSDAREYFSSCAAVLRPCPWRHVHWGSACLRK